MPVRLFILMVVLKRSLGPRGSLPNWSDFWHLYSPCAFVPPFVPQPLFQGLKLNLGVSPTKLRDVCLKARFIEPAEHLVELLAQEKPNRQHGQLLEFHGFAEDPTKYLRGLRIGQLAPRDLQF